MTTDSTSEPLPRWAELAITVGAWMMQVAAILGVCYAAWHLLAGS